MKALDRKLWRDLKLMWSQALTIALVVASGIGGFITSLSAVDSLALARDRYYADGRFADVFASVKRAPLALAESLREIDGVADVQTTVEQMVRVDIDGVADPIIGHLIGLDARRPHRMNLVTLGAGRWPEAGTRADGALEALVSQAFAQARGLEPGARLGALVNGKRRTLVMTGTALSPEFVFAGLWGMPDMRGYGIFWLDHDALAAAYDMDGAFNRLALKLAPGASEHAVAAALVQRLAPWGGRDVVGRTHQASHQMLDSEIKEQRVIGTLLPAIFLGVAAFLLNVVVSRVVATQREQIATLKAIGYPDLAIGAHYLAMVLLIVLAGLALGLALGDRLGTALTALYAEFFRFPRFEHRIAPWLVALSVGVTLATAVLGTLNAIVATVRLAPAEAMRPPAPPRYRRTVMETLGIERIFAPHARSARCPPKGGRPARERPVASAGLALRMIVRNMERRPLRTSLAIGGIAAAVAITMMGNFFRDAIDAIVDTQFTLAMRNDVAVWTVEAVDDRARHALERLPGVTQVEASRFVPVDLVAGHRRERSLLRGYAPRAELYRVIDTSGRELLLDGRGLVLTDRLAAKLGLAPGDTVRVEVQVGAPRTLELTLAATVPETMGLNAYLDRPTLNRLLGDGDVATGYVLAIERGREAQVLDATRAMPAVAGAFSKATMLANMEEISARNVRIMSTVMTAFAAVIAVGVVYNNARIALAERLWELASLRVLGFTRAEVSGLLLGEMAIAIAIALPLGMLLGLALMHGIASAVQSDQFEFPVVIQPRTYAWAALCVVAAGAASALVVRRRVDRLDMVAALKTRE